LKPTEPQIGEIIGSYRLTGLLGRGGMASVYLAEHTRLSRRAAIKILSAQTAYDETAVSRFLTEARLISEIEHPGVVQIQDVIEQQAPLRIAYVMEHVNGPTLRRELDRRRLRPVEVARMGMQLTEALRAIHVRQVIHRDLKPSNVLLTGPVDGDAFPLAKLADFGIAKAQDRPAPHKTATGLIIGTPTYMAPEQVSGEPVGPATDIYALGELLYEMFTRTRVFPEDQRTSLRMKLDPHPPPLDPLPFANSQPVWQLIRACLDPDATLRPSHDVIIEVLQTVHAAPMLDPGWVAQQRPTQLQHTSTFAGPLYNEPALTGAMPGAMPDPVTAPGPAPSVEVAAPPVPQTPWWPVALGLAAVLTALGLIVWILVAPGEERFIPKQPQPNLPVRPLVAVPDLPAKSAGTPGDAKAAESEAPKITDVPAAAPAATKPRVKKARSRKVRRSRARPKATRAPARDAPAEPTPAVHEDLMPW